MSLLIREMFAEIIMTIINLIVLTYIGDSQLIREISK